MNVFTVVYSHKLHQIWRAELFLLPSNSPNFEASFQQVSQGLGGMSIDHSFILEGLLGVAGGYLSAQVGRDEAQGQCHYCKLVNSLRQDSGPTCLGAPVLSSPMHIHVNGVRLFSGVRAASSSPHAPPCSSALLRRMCL